MTEKQHRPTAKKTVITLLAVIFIAASAVGCAAEQGNTARLTYEGTDGYLEGWVTLHELEKRLDIFVQNHTRQYFTADMFWDLYQKTEDGQWTVVKVTPTEEWVDFPADSVVFPQKDEGTSTYVFHIDLTDATLGEGAYRVKTWASWPDGETFLLILEFTVGRNSEIRMNGEANLSEPMPQVIQPNDDTPGGEVMGEDPQTEPADPEAALIAQFQELLYWDGGETCYNGALTCVYDSPEDINLYYVFYNQFPDGEEWSDFTAEEQEYLIREGAKKNLQFDHFPAQKRPAQQLDALLQQYFGVSLSEVQIPDSWVYYEATDSYYTNHSSVHVMEGRFFTVTGVEYGEDGLIYVYYTAEGPIFRQDGTSLEGWEHDMVLTLRANGDGYVAVANQTLRDFETFAGAIGTAVDPKQITVQAETPYQAAEYYVAAWGKAYTAQIPYFIQDYRLLNWGVDEISADGKAVAGWLECSIFPAEGYNGEGGIKFSERNAGYLYGTLSFVLEEQDGNWNVTGWGNFGEATLEQYGYTPLGEIENTVIGFLNEYLTELYCYTNSKWLDYTTGSIYVNIVDELSQADQAIVWAADRNISYLEDKATYWKLGRRYYEINRTDFVITYSDMEVSRSGDRATVDIDAWVSFLYEGETDRSIVQSQYKIELAKIDEVWLITDVMQEVFWFDYEYKNDREALDKEIAYWERFCTSKIGQYDLNGDGVIQSVEFPYAEGEAFGLTGEYATLYSAVAEYVMRFTSHAVGGTYLVLPSITKIYGQYEDEQGNMNYVCGMNTLYFDDLGTEPGQWDGSDVGGAANFVLATVDPDGYLVGFKTWPNGPGKEQEEQLYREYCGPLEDLAEAFINGTESAYGVVLDMESADTKLAQYLSYYFGE